MAAQSTPLHQMLPQFTKYLWFIFDTG